MTGTLLGQYEIEEKLGEGGMGVVYKAHDTKLDRTVALKFLSPSLASSTQDKARFMQEARAASALNHPNVCTIHDIQEHEDQIFIVMEYIEGATLRAKKGGLSFKQGLEIGIQIAEGLAAAHVKGIVHRDIKPENIMIAKDGSAHIMDFGLAKLRTSGSKISRLTKEGSTIGTAGYMSPEQVQGFDTDHRSDIFSFGVLLYELLTGQLPFKGVHEMALAYEIVNVDPAPMSAINPEIEAALDAIVFECLEKDVNERAQSVRQVAVDLRRVKRESTRQRVTRITAARPVMTGTQPPQAVQANSTTSARRPWKQYGGYFLATLIAVAFGIYAFYRPVETGPPMPVVRFRFDLPPDAPLWGLSSGFAISPDGKMFVYSSAVSGASKFFMHRLEDLGTQPISGTEYANYPAFSPDGQWLAFSNDRNNLVKISLFGGPPEPVCNGVGFSRGIHWGEDNNLYFGTISSGIYRVPATGGTPEQLTVPDSTAGELSHRYPVLLPDGKTITYTIKNRSITTFDDAMIVAQQIGSPERKVLVRGGTYGRYLPTGHFLYLRGDNLFAVPFDAASSTVTGAPIIVETGGNLNFASGDGLFDISQNGIIAFAPYGSLAGNIMTMAWMDKSGKLTPFDSVGLVSRALVSPDGRKIAFDIGAANDDIWIYHIDRHDLTRLTFGGGNNNSPVWSPDSRYLYYVSEKGKQPNIFMKPADGSGGEERLTDAPRAQLTGAMMPDGSALSFVQDGDIWILPLEGTKEPYPFIQSPAGEGGERFSPDGRWVMYTSNESGRNEVYVASYPKAQGKWQISKTGGIGLFWSPKGDELYFFNGHALMAATVRLGGSFEASLPRKVCDIPQDALLFDIAPSGDRFLCTVLHTAALTRPKVELVTNWFETVKAKFAAVQR